MLALRLKDDSDLGPVIARVLELAFPPATADTLKQSLNSCAVPPAPSLSKRRLTLDVSYMMCVQLYYSQCGRSTVKYLVADSSPIAGRDWQNASCTEISTDDLVKL
eukprot:7807160-Alexandrium_andersonii.AAC.1